MNVGDSDFERESKPYSAAALAAALLYLQESGSKFMRGMRNTGELRGCS
jgi:hypothetical protein